MKPTIKSFYPLLLMLAVGLVIATCEGPTGAEGPQGSEGPEGPVGPAGMDGSMIHAGDGAPADSIGSVGDYYLDKQAGQLYGPKDAGEWGAPLDLSGEDGQDGSRIYSGNTAPDPALGKVGDYFLNQDTYDLYGPKTENGWGDPINLQGPQGEDATVAAGTGLLLSGDTFSLDTAFTDARYIFPDNNGGFSVPGIFGDGTIPVEGEGTRLMWYPGKAAFRAGRVPGDRWNNTNIGDYSTAIGYNTTATGLFSMAMNRDTEANGIGATALGIATNANANASVAMGTQTTATTYASLIIGRWNVGISGNDINWISSDPLLVAGNGTSFTPSNALVLYKNGNLEIAGTLTESSDRRLKTDIEPLDMDVMGKLGQISPVRFRFKEGTGHPEEVQLGLLAQNVQEQFPELVNTGSGEYLSLSYSKFTAVLLKGLQEQQTQIKQLEMRLNKLEQERKTRAVSFPGPQSTGRPWLPGGLVMVISGIIFWYSFRVSQGVPA